jgi:inorganic triphosphatase YgiF
MPEGERKYDPAAAGLPAARAAKGPSLTARSAAGAVVLAYVRDQVAAILRYDPLVRRDEPDSVHQMRVATRRARSALQAFGAIIERDTTRPLCAELQWLAASLGHARDTEVLLERLTSEFAAIPPALVAGPVEASITAHFTAELAQAGSTALDALNGQRYLRLLDDLDALLADPPLTPLARHKAGKALAGPVRRAQRRLRRALSAVPGAATATRRSTRRARPPSAHGTPPKRQCPPSAARPGARPHRPGNCSNCSATTTTASSRGQCCSIWPQRRGWQGRTPSATA